MIHYYLDTSVLLVYTLARGKEVDRYYNLSDSTDLPHAISAKIWGCDVVVAYDDHFASISDVIDYKTPEEIVASSGK